jgi:predicted ATPase
LALELAAAWMKILPPDELLRRLMQDVLMSAVTPRDLPERQQTMTATVAWSYQLLSTHEQRAFRYLGALPSSFPIEAAASVLGGRDDASSSSDGTLGVVAGLIDKSLVLRADAAAASRPVYLMLETVRAYAALQLAATGEREDALEGLT